MKTIAIDESTLKLLDRLTQASTPRRSHAALVRTAVRQYAERQRQRAADAKDGVIFRKHRRRLARQTRALIAEQARS